MSLARETIEYNWRRNLAAVSVLSLTGLVFYLLLGMLVAQWYAFGAFERELDADIIVTSSQEAERFRSIETFPIESIYLHLGIVQAQPYSRSIMRDFVNSPTGERIMVSGSIIDTAENSMLYPKSLTQDARKLLAVPGAVLISKRMMDKMELTLGDEISVFRNTATIAGYFHAPFDNQTNLMMSARTMLEYRGRTVQSKPIAYLLRLKNGEDVGGVIEELNVWLRGKGLVALEPKNYTTNMSVSRLLQSRQVLLVFYVGGFVIVVATLIATQSLRSALMSWSSQFATMRALGISNWRIVLFTMELSFWIGALAATAAISFGLVSQAVLKSMDFSIFVTLEMIIWVSIILLSMAAISGLLSLSVILKMKPLELLR